MNDCIFCKIVAGEIPAHKVYEDDDFLAFLDIAPKQKGHTLLIPKKHYRWVWDVEEDYSIPTNKVANALKNAFNTDYVVSFVMGDEVPHAHIHLVPRDGEDGHGALIDLGKLDELSNEEMQEVAETIRGNID